MASLKDQVLEIAQIAKECPENLQTLCFEMLLRDLLEGTSPKPKGRSDSGEERVNENPNNQTPPPAQVSDQKGQDDISETDLHIKTRHFMKKYGVTIEHLNNLFYKEGSDFKSLYEDLRTTRMAEGQIRISLLQALRNAMASGEFSTSAEDVRQEASARKCYDASNFTRIFSNNSGMFDFGDRFERGMTSVRLSEEGRGELAQVIKELQ